MIYREHARPDRGTNKSPAIREEKRKGNITQQICVMLEVIPTRFSPPLSLAQCSVIISEILVNASTKFAALFLPVFSCRRKNMLEKGGAHRYAV